MVLHKGSSILISDLKKRRKESTQLEKSGVDHRSESSFSQQQCDDIKTLSQVLPPFLLTSEFCWEKFLKHNFCAAQEVILKGPICKKT